jgi:hypothetical protein
VWTVASLTTGLNVLAKSHLGAGKATKNPACLVPLERPINIELMLEDPLSSDHIGSRGPRYEVPCVVLQQGSSAPTRVGNVAAKGLGHWRQRCGMVESWNPIAALRTR